MATELLGDPIEYIRRQPQRFLRQIPANAVELAGNLVTDALTLGARHVITMHVADWWIVGGDVDWLPRGSAAEAVRVFSQITPLPEAGDNSMRGDVLLTAFAEDIVTTSPTRGRRISLIKGQLPIDSDVVAALHYPEWLRAIAFRM